MNKYPILALFFLACTACAYERLQGPTEVTYWDRAQTYNGYTFFGAQGTTYLIDMEGRVAHTWPLGTNPRLLDNGDVLDATGGDIGAFTGLREVDWSGSNVWQYTETRTGYFPHHDFLRIYNKKLGANTTLYIANKTIASNQCIAAGCNPANGNYTNVTVDAIVEVDAAGTVVWEWCFFDHGIQDYDAGKANYVGAGKGVSNYAGRINLNLPGRPLTNDWLHCVALDYNTNLDQIAVTAAGGEFYVIDHGGTFVAGNPTGSIVLAASTNGDFVYRFGDPARYGQGSPPSLTMNWTVSTTGNKQIGAVSQAAWIPVGLPGAGHFLVFNNGADLFETTPQSYLFEVNGNLNAGGTDTGNYVNPPDAGYTIWSPPGHDTDKQKKNMSRQIVSTFYSMANQAFFSHTGGSAQRLANSNTLVCAATEGHIFEATVAGEVVWEYINPVTTNGVVAYKRDDWPLANAVWRACRYSATHPALAGRTLTATSTIASVAPSYISAPAISGIAQYPAIPFSTNPVTISATVTNNRTVAAVTLTYITGSSTNSLAMTSSGSLYTAQIPACAAGTVVQYFLSAKDDFDNTATSPIAAPANTLSYTVGTSVFATNAALTLLTSGLHFTESPAADAAGNIFFADVPESTIYEWSLAGQLSAFRTNSGGANGLYFDASGNLIACEGANGRVVAITPQTNVTALTSTYGGLRYNEPNDLWIDPAGGVYFTDPVFFTNQTPQGGEYVYYLKPGTGGVIRVVSDMIRPNGLVGTPDGKTLYIADWGAGVVYRYAIAGDGTLSNKTAFANVKCDGMTIDIEGNLYMTESTVLVYNAAGVSVEQLAVPARPTNLEFGGIDRKTLFITTDSGSLYSIRMRAQGLGGATNLPPVIGNITRMPTTPTHADTVTITALATDDVGVASVSLAYSVGTGRVVTNAVFLETMATNVAKPWTGTGCDNPWTVAYKGSNPFEQAANANYGSGNTNGLSFKSGTTNLADSTITTTSGINAQGSSGTIAFYLQTSVVNSNAGWTLQVNPGTGFTTRLSGQTTTSQSWQPYSCALQSGDLVTNLLLRFQFSEGNISNRIFLDQISVKVATGASVSSNIAMSLVGGNLYAAQIPAQTNGATVFYVITAVDTLGLAVATGGSYQVSDTSVDTVGDGIPDWWRAQWFGGDGRTTNGQSCANADPDNDGMSNAQEFLADTNPMNGDSLLALKGISPATNGMRVSWVGGIADTQVVEYRADLNDSQPVWLAVCTNMPPTAITNAVVQTNDFSASNRFYRIRAWR